MRVLHVVDVLDPDAGGPPRIAAQLAAATAALGNDVTVLAHGKEAASGGDWSALAPPFSNVPGIQRVRLEQIPARSGFAGLQMSKERSRLRALVGDSDFVHLHGVWEPIVLRTAETARQLGVPYVVRPAGMLDPWSLRQRWLKKRIALALGYREMLRGAAFIHALTEDERGLIGLLKLCCPVEVIPNGTFEEWIDLPKPKGKFFEKHSVLKGRPYILFLSRLHYKKGLDYLADAFKQVAQQMPEAMLVVAGPDGGGGDAFRARIRRYGIADQVLITGPLYSAEKFAAIVDASVFCLPSREEGFSVAVIESLAMGTPVVISTQCHFPEVGEAGAGKTVPLNAHAIADALVSILSDSPRRVQQGAAGTSLIRGRYLWPRIAESCISSYMRHGSITPASI